jgi:CRP-like cAMP-binding protein
MCRNARTVGAKRDIISDGEKPDHVHLVLEGWAARYKILPDGSRQITAFLLPGDFCDLHVTILAQMDHGIMALCRTRVAYVPHQTMQDLPIDRPQLGRALWRATLVDEAVLRSWIVNLGRREALERIAHLFCELHARLSLVGLVADGQFRLPLTQDVIADATGLTAVHVNRVLKRLRGDDVITLRGGELTIPDVRKLGKIANFDPSYLHREHLIPA